MKPEVLKAIENVLNKLTLKSKLVLQVKGLDDTKSIDRLLCVSTTLYETNSIETFMEDMRTVIMETSKFTSDYETTFYNVLYGLDFIDAMECRTKDDRAVIIFMVDYILSNWDRIEK